MEGVREVRREGEGEGGEEALEAARGEEVGGLGVEVGGEEDFEEGECRGEVEGDWGGEGWGEGRDKKAVGEGGWEEGDEDGDIQQGVAVAVDRNSCSSKCNSLKPSPISCAATATALRIPVKGYTPQMR